MTSIADSSEFELTINVCALERIIEFSCRFSFGLKETGPLILKPVKKSYVLSLIVRTFDVTSAPEIKLFSIRSETSLGPKMQGLVTLTTPSEVSPSFAMTIPENFIQASKHATVFFHCFSCSPLEPVKSGISIRTTLAFSSKRLLP